jgi:hypothetical protein
MKEGDVIGIIGAVLLYNIGTVYVHRKRVSKKMLKLATPALLLL